MKYIADFLDDEGFLVQKHGDHFNAVDSNFLTSNYFYQKMLVGDFVYGRATACLLDYRNEDGLILRYPHKHVGTEESIYWNYFETVSRDNSMGYIILAGHMGFHKITRKIALDILKRFSFFQNTHTVKMEKKTLPDLCFAEWSTILRACFEPGTLLLLWPILMILDLLYLIDIIVKVIMYKIYPKKVSTVFHTFSSIMQKKTTVSTPFSSLGNYIYLSNVNIVEALKYYSRARYDPPIYDIAEKVLRKYSRGNKDETK